MSQYGLQWVDGAGQLVEENIRPLILLGSVSLTVEHARQRKTVSASFFIPNEGYEPYWIPVLKTGQGAMGTLILDRADESRDYRDGGVWITYTFSGDVILDDPKNAEIQIFYGVK